MKTLRKKRFAVLIGKNQLKFCRKTYWKEQGIRTIATEENFPCPPQ